MTLPDLPPPTLVTEAAGLARLLARLDAAEEIAVDTEADSFYSYREKVCLVQISVGEEDYLVDPLAGLDLAGLGRILADPRKTKVFHDGEYDVSILRRNFNFRFAGLFDTRVAAAVVGMRTPGLASVLEERFGVKLDKRMQRSNWAKRPLSPQQVSYARLDTRFLVPLMHALRKELEGLGRTMMVDSECRRLERLELQRPDFDPDEFVSIQGARALKPQERRALRELFVLREQLAEAQDTPPFKVMNNDLLIELARRSPGSIGALTQMKGFGPRLARKLGTEVLHCLQRAKGLPPIEQLPRLARRDGTESMDEPTVELYERVKRWRKGVSDRMGVEAAYLLNRHIVTDIARKKPREAKQLEAIEGLDPWQYEQFRDDLLGVVRTFLEDQKAGRLPIKPRRRPR